MANGPGGSEGVKVVRFERTDFPQMGWIGKPNLTLFDTPAIQDWHIDTVVTPPGVRVNERRLFYTDFPQQGWIGIPNFKADAWSYQPHTFRMSPGPVYRRDTNHDQGWITANVPNVSFNPALQDWHIDTFQTFKGKRYQRDTNRDHAWINNAAEKVFPTTGYLDQFNRSDEDPLSSSWTAALSGVPKGRVVSNVLISDAVALSAADAWALPTNADCEVYLTLPALFGTGPTDALYLYVRLSNANTGSESGYACQFTTSFWGLGTMDTGSFSQNMASGTVHLQAGDSVGLSVYGSTIRAYYKPVAGNWTFLGRGTDTTYTAGSVGFSYSDSTGTGTIDDVGGGPYLVPQSCFQGWDARTQPRLVPSPMWRSASQVVDWIYPNLPVPFNAALYPAIAQLVGVQTKARARLNTVWDRYTNDLSWVHDVIPLTDPPPGTNVIHLRPIAPIMSARRRNRRRR